MFWANSFLAPATKAASARSAVWDTPCLVMLYSSMGDPDWPDFIDVYTGVFTYFGDNKRPGHDLHDTPRRGNKLLQSCFGILHNAPGQRVKIPPCLVFTKGSKGRDVVFRGLAGC